MLFRSNLQVFTNAGAERFRDELESVNSMLAGLGKTQEEIARKAQGMDLLPEKAADDIDTLAKRLEAIVSRVGELESTPMGSGLDKMNSELEQLRSQLGQAMQEQQSLNEAVSGMDAQAANDAYLRLSQTIGGAERRIRDNIDGMERFDREIQDANESCVRLLHGFDGTRRQIQDNVGADRKSVV